MKLNDTFDLGKPPFQGDRTVEWRRIPLGAQIQRATAVVTPIDATAGSNPFAEIIRFNGATGDWGATKTQVPQQWVEVDFHGRRTLARVRGSNLNTASNEATLQVDLGGAYVEINTSGALSGPDDDPFIIQNPLADGSFALPAMAVTKFKLTTTANPDLTEVTIRSIPTNVSLRFGQQPVFWTRVGELAQAETTPDFAASLEAFLADAEVENGFYVVPLVVHSDAIARLRIEIGIEFVVQQDVLPKGLSEVTLPYELDGLPKSSSELITITAPASSRIVPQSSRARITGAFADTRIVYDPTETISSAGFVKTIAPAGKVVISGQDSFAQPISLARDTAATALDLRLEIKEAVKLRLDIREDLDGKPGEVSLLPQPPQPVDVELPGPVGLEQSREASDRERWISVPLPAEFQFKEAGRQKRYWLVLQSIEGEAAWSVAAATAAPQPAETVGLQRLSHRPSDAGLAWREAAATGAGGPLFAFFRLRHLPKRFTMPVAMQVGAGAGAVRVDLGRFQDQGRVDFALDFEELEQARQKHLGKAAPKVCNEVEHLANGDFDKWLAAGGWFANRTEIPLSSAPNDLAVTSDGTALHLVSGTLDTVDAVSGAQKQKPVTLGINANRIVTQTFGSLAGVAGSTQLRFVNTTTRQILGNTFSFQGPVKAMAFNPAGARLYLADSAFLRVFNAVTPAEILSTALPLTPTALAVAPNGRRVYVTIDKGFDQAGELTIFDFDATLLLFTNTTVAVGGQPTAIALTPDGKSALVANQASNSISLLDTATLRVITEFQLQQPPVSVAVSPDCGWAYVATRSANGNAGGTITVIDLVRRAIVDDVVLDPNLKPTPITLKLSPLGDRIFVLSQINTGARRLYAFRRQNLQPEEWNLTSGQITLACLPPSDRTAMLEGISPRDGSLVPVALSQVTPVIGSCGYDFSFWGAAFDMGTDDNDDDAIAVATDLGAMAEIFWLNDECGFLKAEPPIPIKVALDVYGGHEALIPASAAIINFSDSSSSQLMLHRVRLTAPAQATQAEIRFSAPASVTIHLDRVSLMGTADAVSNGDFQVLSNGQIEGWTFPGGATPGLVVTSLEEGLQLRNNGATVIEMMQTASAKGGESFKLELEGRVLSAGTQSPRLEARWLKAGAAAGSPTAIELRSDTTGSAIAQSQSPPGAEKVEIRLTLPPGAALLVQRISLRFQQMISVPVTFIAQAPGELAITGLQIAFEEGRPAPPPIPDRGLCPPTPPGGQPGTGKSDCSFCPGCESEKSMTEVRAMVTDAGRPVLAGACPDCGADLLRFGGALDAGAPRLSFARSIRQPLVVRARPERDAGLATTISTAPVTESPAPAETDLIEVSGIGAARADALKKIGVKTAEALATASPEKVAKAKGFTPAIAQKVISAAERLIAANLL